MHSILVLGEVNARFQCTQAQEAIQQSISTPSAKRGVISLFDRLDLLILNIF